MKLDQIQLDLPYNPDINVLQTVMAHYNCSYEEAYQIDYDENWKFEIRRRFDLETSCVANMFLYYIRPYKTKDCRKIVIDGVEKVTRAYYSLFGIYTIEYQFNYAEFFLKTKEEKKQSTADIIKECLYLIANEQEWDLEPIRNAFKKMEERNYNHYFTYGKKIKSPNKLFTAELYIEHDIESIDFYIIIRNKQDEVIEKRLIVSESPSIWCYYPYMGKLHWISDNEIQLKDKSGNLIMPTFEMQICK